MGKKISRRQFRRFYSAVVAELGEHALRGGTAIGAPVVVKRVAIDHGLGDLVDHVPLPRRSRAEYLDERFDLRRRQLLEGDETRRSG